MANKNLKGRSSADREGDLDDEAIKKMITGYAGSVEGTDATQVVKGLLDAELEDEDLATDCMLCLDVAEAPVFLPGCMHSGCRDCVLAHFAAAEEAGDEVS